VVLSNKRGSALPRTYLYGSIRRSVTPEIRDLRLRI
jgi:hypothetical protein